MLLCVPQLAGGAGRAFAVLTTDQEYINRFRARPLDARQRLLHGLQVPCLSPLKLVCRACSQLDRTVCIHKRCQAGLQAALGLQAAPGEVSAGQEKEAVSLVSG